MTPDHGELLYEGKAKRVFAASQPDRVLVEFKNDATAFNAQKKAQLADKGRLNCQISARLFERLEAEGIPTHYLGLASDTWMVVPRVSIIPLEVVLRNIATGSLCRQTPIAEGTVIDPALLDLYYKDDALGDPLLSEARVHLRGGGTRAPSAIEQLGAASTMCSGRCSPIWIAAGGLQAGAGLQRGGQLLLADEISSTPAGSGTCAAAMPRTASSTRTDSDRTLAV